MYFYQPMCSEAGEFIEMELKTRVKPVRFMGMHTTERLKYPK